MSTIGDFEIPDEEIIFTFSRSSGAGGQNVNKVSSKATLHWNINENRSVPAGVRQRFQLAYGNRITLDGILTLQSDLYRDQPRNKESCLKKLREMLHAVAKPAKRRIITKPTRSSVERRVQTKKRDGEKKKQRKKLPF